MLYLERIQHGGIVGREVAVGGCEEFQFGVVFICRYLNKVIRL